MSNKRFRYTLPEMTVRLFGTAKPAAKYLTVSTIASITGNLSQMGIMSFGVLLLLRCAGLTAYGTPLLWGILTAVCAMLIVICRYTEGVVSHAGAYGLLASMRISLFNTIRRLAPACLMDREKGDIINIAVSDIETVEFFFAHTIGPMCTVVLLPVITLILAFNIYPLFAAVLLPVYLVISVIFPLIAVKAGRPIGARYRTALGRMKSMVLESVYGLRDIQIFGHGKKRLDMIDRTNDDVNSASHGLTLHRQIVTAAPAFFVYLARIVIIAVASYLAARGFSDPAGIIVLSFAASASFSSTQSLTMVVSSLLETYAAAERIFTLEDTEPEVTEPADPVHIEHISNIAFDNVSFGYGNGRPDILRNFSLNIGKCEKLGIAGESGAGKSTVLRLLLRFWDPASGEIRINGIPLKRISLSELHDRIAVLEQDTFLFNASIAENIAIGRPGASNEEIVTAAKRAGIHDFIMTLPDGYATPMGQMGARLSGGERQRIGIARTMITDPDVIVMDEPTSALDVLHEKELLRTLRNECSGKILIIVSHRSSTLSDCTRMIRLENGRAV